MSKSNDSSTDVSNAENISEAKEIQDTPSKQKMENINEIIDIKTLLMSGSSCRTDGLSLQSNKPTDDPVNKSQEHASEVKEVDEAVQADEPRSPSSPINLFCEEGDVSNFII